MTVKALKKSKRILFGFVALSIFVIIVIAGLYPLNFSPQNKTRWLTPENGIRFFGQGHAYSPQLIGRLFQADERSIEIILQPESESFNYIAHILSFVDHRGIETLFIGQWKSHLILQKRTRDANHRIVRREINLRDALLPGEIRHLTVTSEKSRTTFSVNGKLAKVYPNVNFLRSSPETSGRLILGNSPGGNPYWLGQLRGLAIFNRSLNQEEIYRHYQRWKEGDWSALRNDQGLFAIYPFNELTGTWALDHVGNHHVFIPPKFGALRKTALVPPWKDFTLSYSYFTDILTNIAGFIPFGFFLFGWLWLGRPSPLPRLILISIVAAGCTSLVIEIIQSYLPTRNSQLMDVIMNTLGALIGTTLFINTREKDRTEG